MSGNKNKYTYISLFSSAGVGCYGFELEGFDCIATNELIARRLEVQKCNDKCKYESGYICGDITKPEVMQRVFDEIRFWRDKEKINDVTTIIATPPCQGMSIANHKKKDESARNSLVVESIKIINEIKPLTFVMENVRSFLHTLCTDLDGVNRDIGTAIDLNLGKYYRIESKVINFKDYGSNSSRTRTLVIGIRNDIKGDVSSLFPKEQKEKTIREVIYDLPPLTNMGEICDYDIYHSFRPYKEEMRSWIAPLKEGQSAFENEDENLRPHYVYKGQIIKCTNKNGDKYTRQCWDKVAPCIHTRNDILASQNTIHPSDDRVFSVRELMRFMTIPDSFKWCRLSLEELNLLSKEEKRKFIKENDINIRQSIGEAVPTIIFQQIAHNMKEIIH